MCNLLLEHTKYAIHSRLFTIYNHKFTSFYLHFVKIASYSSLLLAMRTNRRVKDLLTAWLTYEGELSLAVHLQVWLHRKPLRK